MTESKPRPTTRSLLPAGAAVVLGVAGIWWLVGRPGEVAPAPEAAAGPRTERRATEVTAPGRAADDFEVRDPATLDPETRQLALEMLAGGEEALNLIGDSSLTPQQDLEVVVSMLETYRRMMKPERGLPTGLNEEVVDVLQGKNPWRLPMIPDEHPQLDSSGRLLDRWGEPLFFHAESMDLLQVRSAGEDRRLWTEDDVVFPEL